MCPAQWNVPPHTHGTTACAVGWWICTVLCAWWERAARGTFWLCVELIKRIFTARLTRIFTLYANMWNTINKGRQFAGTHTHTHVHTYTHTCASCAKNFLSIKFYSKLNLHPSKNNTNNNNQNCALLNSMKIARAHWNWGGCGTRGRARGGAGLLLVLLSSATLPSSSSPLVCLLQLLFHFLFALFSYCQCQRNRVINKMAQNGDTCCCKLEK